MKSILKRAFSKFGNPRYYTLLRLIFLSAIKPKNKGGKIRLHGKQIQYNDMNALMGMYHEIHYKEHYRFPSKNPKPVIIDCGANIGISALYFHEQFPGVNLIAIEADPQVAALLQRNLSSNNCKAEIIQKAAWTSNDSYLNFGQAGADAGSIYASANTIQVPTMRFKELLQQHDSIELIKIDIEGHRRLSRRIAPCKICFH
jgi:FkbM family methyltransferase